MAAEPVRTAMRLGRYQTVARIASGGMAEVYLARQSGPLDFFKLVVIKTIHPHLAREREFVRMLLDEARIAAMIKHPHIIDIYDLGEARDTYFIAMEYLAGESLGDVIVGSRSADQRLGIYSMASLVADCADALHAAHSWAGLDGKPLGIVHRDVTPGNIIVLYTGETKLVDFGIAKARGQAVVTGTDNRLKGKIGYVAPEQLEGADADARCDVYSLGVVLWECLTLRRLFWAANEATAVQRILASDITPPSVVNPAVPRELDQICMRALARSAKQRYQTAKVFHDEIISFLRDANYHDHERVVSQFMNRTFAANRKRGEELVREAMAMPIAPPPAAVERVAANDDGVASVPMSLGIADSGAVTIASDDAPMLMIEHAAVLRGEAGPPEAPASPTVTTGPGPLASPVITSVVPIRKKRGGLWVAALVVLGVAGGGAALVLTRRPGATAPAAATAPPTPAPVATADGSARFSGGPPEAAVVTAPPSEVEPADVPVSPDKDGKTEKAARSGDKRVRRVATAEPPPTSMAPQSAKNLYNEGLRLQVGGDISGAINKFKAAVAADGSFAAAHRGLGLAYERQGRKDRAVQAFKQYLALAPNAADANAIRQRLSKLE